MIAISSRHPALGLLSLGLLLAMPACSEVPLPPSGPDEPLTASPSVQAAKSPAKGDTPRGPSEGVPVKGRLSGMGSCTLTDAANLIFHCEFASSGVVSHLGRARAVWTIPEVKCDLINNELVALSTEGTGTITAANGDQLFGRFMIPAPGRFPIGPNGEIPFHAVLELIDGTGHFAGATGEAVATGEARLHTGAFTGSLEGRIF